MMNQVGTKEQHAKCFEQNKNQCNDEESSPKANKLTVCSDLGEKIEKLIIKGQFFLFYVTVYPKIYKENEFLPQTLFFPLISQ